MIFFTFNLYFLYHLNDLIYFEVSKKPLIENKMSQDQYINESNHKGLFKIDFI